MIAELEIYRAANLLIDRHGTDALIEAARMIDRHKTGFPLPLSARR